MSVFNVIWYSAVVSLVLAALAHFVGERELLRERPSSRGLGWFGPGPTSVRGRKAYLLKRLLTALAVLLAAVAVVLGYPPAV